MAFHHLAVAARDMAGIDAFYSRVLGFELVKVEAAATPEGGFAKHFFYDQGDGELMAFWELHDEKLGERYPTALSTDLGLPPWVNHYAFHADHRGELEQKKNLWLEHGYDVLWIDHHWCTSVYTLDPNGTLVEFCCTNDEFSRDDRERAQRALAGDEIEHSAPPTIESFKSSKRPLHERLAEESA